MLGMFVIPASVFAVQSGNGFFVHDQVNSIAGASSGNGISNQSGGSPLSSQSMSGGGFILFGGAYRGVVPAAPSVSPASPLASASFGGSRVIFTAQNTNTQNPVIANPLPQQVGISNNVEPIANLPVGQSQNTTINEVVGAVSTTPSPTIEIAASPENPPLFDVTVEAAVSHPRQNFYIFLFVGIIFAAVMLLSLLFFEAKRVWRKRKINKLIHDVK